MVVYVIKAGIVDGSEGGGIVKAVTLPLLKESIVAEAAR